MRIDVEINAYLFLESRFKFRLQGIGKFTHPSVTFALPVVAWRRMVVFLTVADEDLPAGRQVSYSYPEMMLGIKYDPFAKGMKELDIRQIFKQTAAMRLKTFSKTFSTN
jgi:hypothetical protein